MTVEVKIDMPETPVEEQSSKPTLPQRLDKLNAHGRFLILTTFVAVVGVVGFLAYIVLN